ncbi:MAG: hypothetical protein NVSMB62_14400 [Acidobacteriaceae bacterium]
MDLNPYAKYLGTREPVSVLQSTYIQIAKLASRIPEDQIALKPPSGKRSAREIVAHLADCELVFSFRLRQALAEDNPTIQPFDQERWASRYTNCDMDSSMRLFEALRNWNLLLLEGTTTTERARSTIHPERGAMTFWTIVETMAGHDLNHLAQLERLITPPEPTR